MTTLSLNVFEIVAASAGEIPRDRFGIVETYLTSEGPRTRMCSGRFRTSEGANAHLQALQSGSAATGRGDAYDPMKSPSILTRNNFKRGDKVSRNILPNEWGVVLDVLADGRVRVEWSDSEGNKETTLAAPHLLQLANGGFTEAVVIPMITDFATLLDRPTTVDLPGPTGDSGKPSTHGAVHIGDITMTHIFRPLGITNVADVNMQALWDQIERVLDAAGLFE